MAAVQDQTTTDEKGIRSIPVCYASSCTVKARLIKLHSCAHTPSTRYESKTSRPPEHATNSRKQPYLDSDMQSRWFDFGGNTIIRADQYAAQSCA